MSYLRTRAGVLIVSLLIAFLAGGALAADSGPRISVIQPIVERLGTTKGLCVVLGLERAEAALELANASEFLFYIQSPNASLVQDIRRRAAAAGLLNRRLCAEHATAARLPLADNLADAVLVLSSAPASTDELLRILRPGGVAFLPDRQIVKPAPAGTDAWSHPYHGPDNNPLSSDQLVAYPYLTQFLAEPLFSSQPEVTVAAGGRIFKAFGHMTFREYQNPVINTLYAFNAFNGTTLWKRPLKAGFMIHRNTLIATSDILYLADDESCKLIDAATGQTKDQILLPEGLADGPVWKWMALENNILYALVGPTEITAPVTKGTDKRIGGWPWGMWTGYDYANPKTAWGFGQTLVAIDLKTRKTLWHWRDQRPIDSRGLCMKSGRIYFYCPDHSLACLDAKSGKELWRASSPDLLDAIGPNQKAQHYVTGFATSTYIKCTDKVILFAGPQRKNLAAVSTDNGKLLWKREGGNFQLVLREEAIYALGDQFGKSFKFDYLSGNVLAEFPGRRACTRATGTLDSVFCRAQEGTIRWDVATNALNHLSPMRPACHDGVIASDGLLFWGPWICGCHLDLYGIVSLASAGRFNFQPAPNESSQLQRVNPKPPASFSISPNDWPAYQANNQRTRTTRIDLLPNPSLRWEYKPSAPAVPTAPVAAGGLVFAADSAGLVHALDGASGEPRWTAPTAASIYFPPALADGQAFVGSNDGHVHAFDAATGLPLWRFRPGPADRRIPVYGELMSTWPVAGGVLVEAGTLYAAAGISHFDGTHVYALDAATGRVQWHNSSSGSIDPAVKNGINLCGPLSLQDNQLAFPGGNVYPTALYDLSTGQCANKPAGPKTSRRIVLHPRSAWEPIESDTLPTPAGTLRLQYPRGGRLLALSLQPAGAARPAWSVNLFAYAGAVATPNAVLLLARPSELEDGQPAPYRLTALNLKDGSALWSHRLPAAPVPWGLAIDAQARIILTLEDGRILAFQ